MKFHPYHLITALILILISFFVPTTYADTFPRTELDFLQLPPFCKARMSGQKNAFGDYWAIKIGPPFEHIHHLCSGLHGLNLAKKMSPKKIQYRRILRSALGGIDYVIVRTDSNFFLYPYMLLNKAEILILSKKLEDATSLLRKALSIKQNYSLAYAKLSKIYILQGNKKKAKEVLLQGLKHKPDSKLLQIRLSKL